MGKNHITLLKFNVGIDNSFTVKEKGLILNAITRWHEAINCLATFHVTDMNMKNLIYDNDYDKTDFAVNIIKSYSTDKAIQEKDKYFGHPINGLCSWHSQTSLIFVVVDRINFKLEFINLVMHEIGHLLGMKHLHKGTLMYKTSNRPAMLTNADFKELARVWRAWIGLEN